MLTNKIGGLKMCQIITDHKWKQFHYWDTVPANIYKDYDWLDPQDKSDNWIEYRRSWYHVSDFMRCQNFSGWHGYHCDSFFSGVLVEISDDGEQYRIGTCIS
jgi:hypothetical protein